MAAPLMRALTCVRTVVFEHQILDGRHGIDVHAIHLFGELTVGIAERAASGKRLCLWPTRVDGAMLPTTRMPPLSHLSPPQLCQTVQTVSASMSTARAMDFTTCIDIPPFSIVPIRISQMKDKTDEKLISIC